LKIYQGNTRESDGEHVVTVDGQELPLRLELANHSPTGFAWGYNGSGPAQLALAICADVLGDDEQALAVYQEYKTRVLAPMRDEHDNPVKYWMLEEDAVRTGIEQIRRDQEAQKTVDDLNPRERELVAVERGYPESGGVTFHGIELTDRDREFQAMQQSPRTLHLGPAGAVRLQEHPEREVTLDATRLARGDFHRKSLDFEAWKARAAQLLNVKPEELHNLYGDEPESSWKLGHTPEKYVEHVRTEALQDEEKNYV
jgi:Family of unknown function (DUF6166)